MKKTLLLLFAAIFTMGAMAKVGKITATADVASGDVWVFGFNNPNGIDFNTYKYLVVDVPEDNTAQYRVKICCGGNYSSSSYITDFTTSDTKIVFGEITLQTAGQVTDPSLDQITRIQILTSDLTLSKENIYFATDDYETMTITTTIDENSDVNKPFQWYAGEEFRSASITNILGTEQGGGALLFGYSQNISVSNGYFNINGYGNINIHTSAGGSLRLLNDVEGEVTYNLSEGDNVVANSKTKCTSFKVGWGSANYTISSIDFIAEHQAANTESAFDIAASTGSKVSYDRSFVSGQKCTICLPFGLSEDEVRSLGMFYALSSINDGKATFIETPATKAYEPYLFIPSSDGKLLENIAETKDIYSPYSTEWSSSGGFIFVGTLQAKSNVKEGNDGYEIYGFNAADGKFVHVTGNNVNIDAFRAYIKVPTTVTSAIGGAPRSIIINIDGTTGINDLKAAKSSSERYDATGKRVGENYKGVTISNGKKILQN